MTRPTTSLHLSCRELTERCCSHATGSRPLCRDGMHEVRPQAGSLWHSMQDGKIRACIRGEPPTLSGSYFLSSSAKSLSYEPETAMMRGRMLSLFFST